MIKFFHDLTKRNWGWPYHVMIADAGQIAGILILSFLFSWTGLSKYFTLNHVVVFIAFIVMGIGYFYEAKQARENINAKEEFKEDMIGNFCGVILGSLKAYGVFYLL